MTICFQSINRTLREDYRLLTKADIMNYEAVQLMNSLFPNGERQLEILKTHPTPSKLNDKINWDFVIGKPEQLTVPVLVEEVNSVATFGESNYTTFFIFYCRLFLAQTQISM